MKRKLRTVWCNWACYHVDVTLVLIGYNYKVVVCLRVYAFVYEMMSRLIAKGIIRSYSMRQRRIAAAVKPPNGIVSNCDVCGGFIRFGPVGEDIRVASEQ